MAINVEYIGVAGYALSVAETTAMRASLAVLSEKLRTKVVFWGKVLGVQNDYLLAQALPPAVEGPAAARKSFYSVDGGVNWVALAQTLTAEQAELADQLRGRFFGQPAFLYKVRRDVPPEPLNAPELPPADAAAAAANGEDEEGEEAGGAEGEEEKEEEDAGAGGAEGDAEAAEADAAAAAALKPKKPKFRIIALAEADRLAHFVLLHDRACRLVVRGELLCPNPATADNSATWAKNRTFGGLTVDEACELRSFFKLYALGGAESNAKLFGATYAATRDFLSPVTDDRPEGVWTLKYDATLGIVAVENLLFAGSLFWHKPGTTESGQVYIGSGERNLDLCFMLP